MGKTQLLCTFATEDSLQATLEAIVANYDVAFDTIYVLENLDTPCAFCCTYNIFVDSTTDDIPSSTISLHRKKATNTLYTINALNMLVSHLNGGRTDKNFQINWEDYRNTILVSAYNNLKVIKTKLNQIVRVSEV